MTRLTPVHWGASAVPFDSTVVVPCAGLWGSPPTTVSSPTESSWPNTTVAGDTDRAVLVGCWATTDSGNTADAEGLEFSLPL